ncbi:MAG: hypothetical protein PHT94_00900 [Candidatus Nanoarchaeia archaeon]|nr:hypothetical protein [Candidatus Nanoarchaeia archaeon]
MLNVIKELDVILSEYYKNVIEIAFCDKCHEESNAEDLIYLDDIKLCKDCYDKKEGV